MTVPNEVHDLVERFDRDIDAFKHKSFNEELAKGDFISPLMKLLGWDIYNQQGKPPAYRDVIMEDRVKVGGGTKAPDYGFYAGGERRFFLEAKKPSVDIAGDVAPAVQLRRYAWSAKLPLSILTDFEEFAVYDCRFEPVKKDKSSTARLDFITYDRYADRWDDIEGLFSREAVLSGSREKYADANRKRRGTQTVDAAFLREIEGWRSTLARDLAARNDLNTRQLNHAVQLTIDRLIFLRMAEDRGIEDYGRLLGLTNGTGVYGRLVEQFRDADDRYNSGLFHFRNERGRGGEPDELTTNLKIDDGVLDGIIRGLYYPESPYEFSVLPVDVLGQVYEQFLGSVIHLEDGHTATVEQKPEVRKAGGVYYTPTYIVDYIVENTVGKLLEGKKPGPRGGASKLKIVDPACGSGSFLIGAYEYLLDWHRDRYLEDGPEKHRNRLYEGAGGEWHLTIDEKKRILLNNIYGVDIDPQAVEVTKLSLLLKVLEGESEQSLQTQLRMFQERALPDLRENIKCGNSLIGPDFYENEQMVLLDEEEHYRINVFDWQAAFPQVFDGENPGFDAVIGNPPYISMLQLDKTQHSAIKPYWKRKFKSAAGAFDIYVLFVEQSFSLVKSSGLFSFIIPNKFLAAEYASEFRKWLITNTRFLSLLDLSRVKVWSAAVYPVIPVLKKDKSKDFDVSVYVADSPPLDDLKPLNLVSSEQLDKTPDRIWSFVTRLGGEVLLRALERSVPLEEIAEVYGATTVAEGSEYPTLLSQDGNLAIESSVSRFVVSGAIHRYHTTWPSEPIQFTHEKYEQPLIKLEAPMPERRIDRAQTPKIIIGKVAREPRAFPDIEGEYVGAYTTYVFLNNITIEYITGLINSRFMEFLYRTLYDALAMSGGYLRFQPPQVRRLPIRTIDFSDVEDVARHETMVGLVGRMLKLHEKLAGAKMERERTVIGHQISATDRQIDNLVYELYGLTDEEIRIVEEATAR